MHSTVFLLHPLAFMRHTGAFILHLYLFSSLKGSMYFWRHHFLWTCSSSLAVPMQPQPKKTTARSIFECGHWKRQWEWRGKGETWSDRSTSILVVQRKCSTCDFSYASRFPGRLRRHQQQQHYQILIFLHSWLFIRCKSYSASKAGICLLKSTYSHHRSITTGTFIWPS